MKYLLLILFSVPLLATGQPNMSTGVSGNNMTRYWMPNDSYTTECTPQLIHRYRQVGLQCVRVPISDQTLYQDNNPGVLNPAHLLALDTAIVKKIIDSGRVVVLDAMHLMGSTALLVKLASDPAQIIKLRKYWVAVIRYFKKYGADRIAFELFNEPIDPTGKNPNWWIGAQDSIVKDIREIDTLHWLIVTGMRNDVTMDGLLTMGPPKYRRLIFGFHFYQSDLFVMQGRDKYPWPIPYPGYPGCTDSIKKAPTNVQFYGNRRGIWNAGTIDARIKIAADFGAKYGVPIWLGEFMCFTWAPRQDRLRWMADVTAACRKYGIGFCMWDPDGATVRLVTYGSSDKTQPVFDTELLKAMGIIQ